MLKKLIYSIFVFLSSEFSIFCILKIFRIIFRWTYYDTTIFEEDYVVVLKIHVVQWFFQR